MTGQERFFRSGEFADIAGVTIRTLRFYDRCGLLSPARRTEKGHRIYDISDLGRLQQIQTLKFIGLSLKDIGQLLNEASPDIGRSLRAQRRALTNQMEHLKDVINSIDEAEETLATAGQLDWTTLARIIKAIQMEKSAEWFKSYYNQEQLDSLAQRPWSSADQAAIEKEWNHLYATVRAHLTQDPSCPQVQKLAEKWLELVGRFTQGDPGIEKSLQNAYSNMEQAPDEIRDEFKKNQDIFTFMNEAIAIYKMKNPGQ